MTFEPDQSGTFNGAATVYAPPLQLAKFGFLYLNDGIWEGRRFLPEGWVRFSTSVPDSYGRTELNIDQRTSVYGAGWWVNQAVGTVPQPWPDAPADTFSAWGYRGQYVFVIPSKDIVIVRTGEDRDVPSDINSFLKLALEAF